MSQSLYDFFQSSAIKSPTDGSHVAGWIDGSAFKYYKSTSPMLPAAVNALEAKKGKGSVYTNRDDSLWIKHFPLIKAKSATGLLATTGDGATMIDPALQTVAKWPRQIVALDLTAPIPGGGLHEAAGAASKSADLTHGSLEKGLTRALRYYMLAAYALVDISGQEAYQGLKNYVGVLLVSDKGEILAAGINTGSFRHAEVSALLSYFRKNPIATKLPEKSILFSTLTPCKGCTGYLTVAKAASSLIYFGQEDTGKDGKVGKKISSQLSTKTKEPLGRSKETITGALPDEDEGPSGVATAGTVSAIHKVQVDTGLASCMGDSSIALQIGKAGDSRKILRSASDALIHKMLKSETRKSNDEEAVKRAVLQYIGQWLGTTKSVD